MSVEKEYISTYPRVVMSDIFELTDERGYCREDYEGHFIHETLLRLKELEKQVEELKSLLK